MILNMITMGKCSPRVPQMEIFQSLMCLKRTNLIKSAVSKHIKDLYGKSAGLILDMVIFWHLAASTER